jgi:hypothetical protein
MSMEQSAAWQQLHRLVDEYRQQCLCFLREDYYPATTREALRVLEYIERRGDVAAFRKAAQARQWLLQDSSNRSVV